MPSCKCGRGLAPIGEQHTDDHGARICSVCAFNACNGFCRGCAEPMADHTECFAGPAGQALCLACATEEPITPLDS